MTKPVADLGTRIAESLAARGDTVAAQLLSTYRHNPGYSAMDEDTVARDLLPVAAANERLLLRRLRGLPYAAEDASVIAESAVRRFAQGVPESEVTRAYRLWSMAIWTLITETAQTFDDADPSELGALASVVLEHNEYTGGIAVDAYESERSGIWINTLLTGDLPIDRLVGPDVTREQLDELEGGIKPARAQSGRALSLLLVTARPDGDLARRNAMVREIVDRWHAAVPAHRLVAVDGRVVVLIGRLVDWSEWRRDLRDATLEGVVMAIATSSCLADLVTRYAELREVLEVGKLMAPAGRPLAWNDTLLGSLVRSPPDPVRSRLRDTYAALVSEDARTAAPLVATLEAFLAANLNVRATAKALYAHPNTIRYRLTRIHALTGLDALDGRDRLVLRLALGLRDLENRRTR